MIKFPATQVSISYYQNLQYAGRKNPGKPLRGPFAFPHLSEAVRAHVVALLLIIEKLYNLIGLPGNNYEADGR
jgi:hypothetical protein